MNFNFTIVNFMKYYTEYGNICNIGYKRFDQRDSDGYDSIADMSAFKIVLTIACSYDCAC